MTDEPRNPDPRHRLLEAAEVLFAAHGYEGASVRDICDRAGMNVASVNYHFGGKERLYIEAVKAAHGCCTEGAPPPTWEPGVPPAQKLRDFIRMMLRQMHGPVRPTALQLVMREMANPSAAAEEVVHGFIKPMAHGLRDIVRELYPDLPDDRVLMIGFSVVGQCLYYRQNRNVSEMLFGKDEVAALGLEAVTDHVTQFTLAALGEGKPIRNPAKKPTTPRARR